MDKKELRKIIKEKRANLEIDCSIFVRKIKQTDLYKESKNIMIFYPMKNEINLLELLKDESKQFYLPRVNCLNLECCPYSNGDKLCLSCYKTQEPISSPVLKDFVDLVIVPALCVDKNNYRLGYGGGFYDRFLKDYLGKSIVCVPKEFVLQEIFLEEQDIPVNLVITD